MKIVWVSHSGDIGGAELCLWEAAKALKLQGCEMHAILPGRGNLANRLESIGVIVNVVPYLFWTHQRDMKRSFYRRFRRLIGHLRAANKISRLFRRSKPDIVITNTLTIPVGAFAARWTKTPHIWYIHEFGKEDHNSSFDYGKLISFFLMTKLSQNIIVNSLAVFSKFKKCLPEKKLRLVYYAVEVPQKSSKITKSNDVLNLIIVGRIDRGKRQEDAIRAMFILMKKGLNLHLTILGKEDSEYGYYVRKLTKQLGIEKNIDFVPFTDDPFSFLNLADVALMCSGSEAFGRVTIEAMKIGKPVVGSNSGATAELILDGWNGFLYHPGEPEDLAKKIDFLYHDRAFLKKLGNNAKEWSNRNFSLNKYASDLINIFDGVEKKSK